MSGLFRQTLFAVGCFALASLSTTARAAYYDIDVFTTPGVPGTGGDVIGPDTSIDITEAYTTPIYEFPVGGTVNFGTVDLFDYALYDQYGDFAIFAGAVIAVYNGVVPCCGIASALENYYGIPNSCNTGQGGLMQARTCNDQQEQYALDALASPSFIEQLYPPIVEQLIFSVSAGDSLQLAWTEPFTYNPPTPTPLPATLPLFAVGLGAIGLFGRRKRRKDAVTVPGT